MKKFKSALVTLMIFTLLVGSVGVFLADSNVANDTVATETMNTSNHEPKPLGT